jgi:hypothetical protein
MKKYLTSRAQLAITNRQAIKVGTYVIEDGWHIWCVHSVGKDLIICRFHNYINSLNAIKLLSKRPGGKEIVDVKLWAP